MVTQRFLGSPSSLNYFRVELRRDLAEASLALLRLPRSLRFASAKRARQGGQSEADGAKAGNQDFIVSLLRCQVKELSRLLNNIEESNTIDEHIQSGLKQVEVNLRGLRKLCFDHY